MVTPAPAKQIITGGYIADLRVAKKYHQCEVCRKLIEMGTQYYTVVKGGGGLGWLKHPDRVHIDCLNDYLKAQEYL